MHKLKWQLFLERINLYITFLELSSAFKDLCVLQTELVVEFLIT